MPDADKAHKMHVENGSCDCGANDCHGHTVHYVRCSCGFQERTVNYASVQGIVLQHSPDFATYKQAIADTEHPIWGGE